MYFPDETIQKRISFPTFSAKEDKNNHWKIYNTEKKIHMTEMCILMCASVIVCVRVCFFR